MLRFISKNLLIYFSLFYFCLATLTIYFFDGTGDAGDSIAHFLFAKYALFTSNCISIIGPNPCMCY